MQERVGLLLDRRHDGLRRVAEVEDADAAGEVDVLLAVDVDQARAVRVAGEDRLDGNAASDILVALGAERVGA